MNFSAVCDFTDSGESHFRNLEAASDWPLTVSRPGYLGVTIRLEKNVRDAEMRRGLAGDLELY
jgi:hypothetical protein